jgi:twinkle protein
LSDITIIKRSLAAKAKEIAECLLPNGILDGREWCVGSVQGEPGKSLKVCVSGAKAGVWTDFAEGGEGGDLIDLWCAVRRVDLGPALDQIRAQLGMEQPTFDKPARQYRRPERPKCSAPKSAVKDYLIQERKLSERAIAAYHVGERNRTMVFPYLLGSELILVKYIGIDRDQKGHHEVTSEAGCEDILFGWPVIEPNAREVTITEGEIDAMTAFDYGFPALSVPRGGGGGAKQKWIESDFDRLSRFEVIYLALDMDGPGEEAVQAITDRLGRHRCRRVKLPHKDLNACRMADVKPDEIRACFANAKTLDPPELRSAGEFTDDVIRLFWPADGASQGYRLPYDKIGDRLLFRPGELTIWTGPAGSGKSQLLSHGLVGMGDQGARVCLASLEMKPAQLLKRMVKQAANVDRATEPCIRTTMNWLNEFLWIFDVVGKSPLERILDVFEYARARYGCDVFVIDSLMRLGVGSEDYEGQEKIVYEMVNWTVGKSVHLHLVAHSRKGDKKHQGAPEIEDVKGAAEIGFNAFNILGIWRDRNLEEQLKRLEEDAALGNQAAALALRDAEQIPPVILNVAKQRNGDWEGKCGLWFNQATYQYRSSRDNPHGTRYSPRIGQEAAE